MAICKINYTDGHSENVPVTMRATCKAEEHGLKEGWGTAANSPIRFGLYSAYAAMRMAGRSLPGFDQWLDTVAGIDTVAQPEPEETTNPTE